MKVYNYVNRTKLIYILIGMITLTMESK